MRNRSQHPLESFGFCPKCGSDQFRIINKKAKHCSECGFTYYYNASAAVACFLRNGEGEVLVAERAKEPAKMTLDLVGGFVDNGETAEEAAQREIVEETGLVVNDFRYLFSQPNIYRYSEFDVHTLDIFFECRVDSFDGYRAADDVAELRPIKIEKLNEHLFGFPSTRQAVTLYKNIYSKE